MDERYERGKIYTIRCRTDETLIYVGATIETRLSARFCSHKRNKSISLYKYVNDPKNLTTWKDWYIELHEVYPCTCRMELCRREGEVIREIATINKVGYGTPETYKEYKKEYNKIYLIDNKEKIAEYKKAYRNDNKENIAEKEKAYQNDNKENIAERKKAYYNDNKERIAEKTKTYQNDNKEYYKEYYKTYQNDNKERIAEYNKAYRKSKKSKNPKIQA